MEVALISEELFKEYAPIKEDTIITKFIPYTILAQKMYIRKIIGYQLYAELQTQIKAASVEPTPDPNPITPANQALLIEIAPALASFAVYQGLPFHWASIVNKGITIRESDNSKGIDVNDVSQLRRWLKDDAEQWAVYLREYLNGCCKDYPLYPLPDGCGCGETASDPIFESGIFIPKRRKH